MTIDQLVTHCREQREAETVQGRDHAFHYVLQYLALNQIPSVAPLQHDLPIWIAHVRQIAEQLQTSGRLSGMARDCLDQATVYEELLHLLNNTRDDQRGEYA